MSDMTTNKPSKGWRLLYLGFGILIGATIAMFLVIVLFAWIFSTNPLPPFPWLSGFIA